MDLGKWSDREGRYLSSWFNLSSGSTGKNHFDRTATEGRSCSSTLEERTFHDPVVVWRWAGRLNFGRVDEGDESPSGIETSDYSPHSRRYWQIKCLAYFVRAAEGRDGGRPELWLLGSAENMGPRVFLVSSFSCPQRGRRGIIMRRCTKRVGVFGCNLFVATP